MSERTTEVYAGDEPALLMHGHVSRQVAIERTRAMLETERDRIARQLATINAGHVSVYHQRGVIVARDRRLLPEGS